MSKVKKIGPVTIRPHIRDGQETGKWQLDIPATLTSNGQRRRKLFDNKTKAEETARRLKRGLENRSLGFSETTQYSGLLFHELAAKWLEHEKGRVGTLKKRQSSLDGDEFRLKAILNFFGKLGIGYITEQSIIDFQALRIRQGRRPATVNTDVRTLVKILNWGIRRGYLEKMPRVEQIPESPREVNIPTQEELGKILEEIVPSALPVVWFMAETGCRKGEAFNLTWDCVDEANGWVEFKAKDGWTPKTRQSQRRVPIGNSLLELLKALPKDGTHVFPSRSDPNKPRDNVRRALDSAVIRSGVAKNGKALKISPHVLRKAFATRQAEGGTPQRILQALLGHAPGTKVTDRHYVQATEEAKRTASNMVQLNGVIGREV